MAHRVVTTKWKFSKSFPEPQHRHSLWISNYVAIMSPSIPARLTKPSQDLGFPKRLAILRKPTIFPTAVWQQVLEILLSTSTGAGLTILRNIITTGLDELNSPSSQDAMPNYVWDGSDGEQVLLSQQATNYGVTTIYAHAWSALAFM